MLRCVCVVGRVGSCETAVEGRRQQERPATGRAGRMDRGMPSDATSGAGRPGSQETRRIGRQRGDIAPAAQDRRQSSAPAGQPRPGDLVLPRQRVRPARASSAIGLRGCSRPARAAAGTGSAPAAPPQRGCVALIATSARRPSLEGRNSRAGYARTRATASATIGRARRPTRPGDQPRPRRTSPARSAPPRSDQPRGRSAPHPGAKAGRAHAAASFGSVARGRPRPADRVPADLLRRPGKQPPRDAG